MKKTIQSGVFFGDAKQMRYMIVASPVIDQAKRDVRGLVRLTALHLPNQDSRVLYRTTHCDSGAFLITMNTSPADDAVARALFDKMGLKEPDGDTGPVS